MTNFFKRICAILLAVLSLFPRGMAQQGSDYAVQANILYRFTKYVDWPESKKSGDFVIAIVGDSPLYEELKAFVTNKFAGSQKIVVRKVSANTETYNCHILFIGEDEANTVRKIAARTAAAPILLVTESEGMALRGACINFTMVGDNLKLEINKSNIEKRNLEVATELLGLAKLVK